MKVLSTFLCSFLLKNGFKLFELLFQDFNSTERSLVLDLAGFKLLELTHSQFVLLADLLQLREGPFALCQPLLQADDLVLQTLVQSLLVFDRLRFDLQLLERPSSQELPNLALDENNSTKTSLVLLALKPASNVGLDYDGLAVAQQLEVTGAREVSTHAGLQQDGTVFVSSGKC